MRLPVAGHDSALRFVDMRPMLQVKVNFKSSGLLYGRSPDDFRGLPPQRRGVLRAAVLRGARADPVRARRLGPSPLSARGPAPHRLHRLRAEDWLDARRDRRRARAASAQPHARPGGLGADLERMDPPRRRPDRRAPAAARQPDRRASAAAACRCNSASSPIQPTAPAAAVPVRASGLATSGLPESRPCGSALQPVVEVPLPHGENRCARLPRRAEPAERLYLE